MSHAFKRTPSHSTSSLTVDHAEIRGWVEKHQGRPATVRGSGRGGVPGELTFIFPHSSNQQQLEPITWDEFFDRFERSKLAMLYHDEFESLEGEWFELVSRDAHWEQVI